MFGAMSDKAHAAMIQRLCEGLHVKRVTIARMDNARYADVEQLAEEFRSELACPVAVCQSVAEAWADFLKHRGDGLAFCAGSLYLVGAVKSLLNEENEHDQF